MSIAANTLLEWSDDNGTTWYKVPDHGRQTLNVAYDRTETRQRMANGYMRRYTVAKKRTWTVSWNNMPSATTGTGAQFLYGYGIVAGGGLWIQNWHDTHDDSFLMRIRAGKDITGTVDTGNNPVPTQPIDTIDPVAAALWTAGGQKGIKVMVTDFSKEIVRRGKDFDLWNLDIQLEEC